MEIELRNIAKSYGQAHAVRDLSFSLTKGEMIALLGPSGCGKTTTLRMVAGFIRPSSGTIVVRGQDVTRLPPHKRDTGLVFQNYALFPHMTVTQNIAFGLNRRGVKGGEQKARIAAMIAKLKLNGLEARYPRQLSGGQQQRVAVARALVINPAILLLDEPFSNLDAKLRESTGIELRRIQQELGLTSIFVTHDQHEAMSIADRIAVMSQGRIEQVGTASQIYERPASRFVADFIGRANFLQARVTHPSAGEIRLDIAPHQPMAIPAFAGTGSRGEPVEIMVRPENVGLSLSPAPHTLPGRIEVISYQGAIAQVIVRVSDSETVTAECKGRDTEGLQVGMPVHLSMDPASLHLFRKTGEALRA